MLSIKEYNEKTTVDNGIEEIIIDILRHPLNNLPITVNKITIKKQINVFRRERKMPYGCELIIKNVGIDNMETFNKVQEDDYLDITEIILNNYDLEEFPMIIFNLTNLQILSLTYNQITNMPDSFASLTNLKILHLYNNQITEIPDSIAFLTNLQTLHLSYNQITKISDSIASLTNLQTLYLSENQITEIPDSIASLTNLQELYLSNNKITKIPEWLKNMKIRYLHY